MTSRELNPAERMVDAFDRANTLSFTVIAEVRGALTHTEIESALRKLEKRHPLLRAQVVRERGEVAFAHGEGTPIGLLMEQGDQARLQALAAKSIEHRLWPDAGPRAELTWLRMDEERSALLLCLHHLVSDGSSGMIAMRDLLAFIASPDQPMETLESPGLHAFLPAGHGGMADVGRALSMVVRELRGARPRRLRAAECPPAQRTQQLSSLSLSEVDSARLLSRARRDGATVHGVLCAALSFAVAAERDGKMQQRITHPVDMRRYLRGRYPDARAIDHCVGYYVSSVDTDHRVDVTQSFSAQARAITQAVRDHKAQGEPLLTAPVAGPWVTRLTRRMSPERFCAMAERDLMLATFSLTNLGPLETLGLRADLGPLQVDDVSFVAAGSVLAALGASATSFGGRIRFNLSGTAPLIAPTVFARLDARVRDHLASYVGEV